jgi:MerR family transcriptional regulator, mercuric resistance operon regulatory protein
MNSAHHSYTRGSLARQTGVNAETIRYYEKIGVMPEPPRSEGGHRVYDETHLQRLSFIRRCRELGFVLNEIRGLLELVDTGHYTCAQVRDRTVVHLHDVQRKIADLQKMEGVLEEMVDQCEGELVPDCPIINALSRL